MRKRLLPLSLVVCGLAFGALPAYAHIDDDGSKLHDDGAMDSGKETHSHDQHGGHEGHLPATKKNVEVVGRIDTADGPGRVADVSAKGNYAYLTRFYEPECDTGGVDIVDISNPAAPAHVATIPSHLDTYSGEGSHVVSVSTPKFRGDLLVYQNETCGDTGDGGSQGIGGITLVDVTNPHRPKKLIEGFGDFSVNGRSQTHANESHSAFAWQDGRKAYVVMVDNEESTDIDIVDITDPVRPQMVSETDLTNETSQPLGAVHGDAVFLHDMVVKKIGTRQVLLASYWDGGYAKLDVTDPANPVFISDTDYPALDPVRLDYGQEISPEGNAHQAEFTRDDKWFIATDEDFDPFRASATITSGTYKDTKFTAVQGTDVPHIGPDVPALSGDTVFVGMACTAADVPDATAAGQIAVIERGVCTFTEKAQAVQAKGYAGGIVFNRTGVDGCDALLTMLVEADIPMVFVARSDGLRILDASFEGYNCSDQGGSSVPKTVGAAGASVDINAVFDGWGYVHQYDATTMEEVGTYALPEGQDPKYGDGFGDLSVHEVATDPDKNLAYLSYYAGGFRVLKYGAGGMNEVGRFIAEGGNNFWGVEVHKHPNGQKYVLASDRDSGLWIFRYTGR